MRLGVERVNWFSTYHVHHRVAESFRSGPAFLVGDAAHVHSPVGGQGMNTGIGDAVNLAWKLAAVLRGRTSASARERLLDSYERERQQFARRLVSTTDRAFTFVSRRGRLARFVRVGIVPRVLPALTRRQAVRRFMFRTLSQTQINYRASALSRGKAGAVHGGDRLPWTPVAASAFTKAGQAEPSEPTPALAPANAEDNFAPLRSLDWQAHVYGSEPAIALRQALLARSVPLHVFPWSPRAKAAGLARDAVYLVRPDGYVALAEPHARPDVLARYLTDQCC
jgi:hypothetical protein